MPLARACLGEAADRVSVKPVPHHRGTPAQEAWAKSNAFRHIHAGAGAAGELETRAGKAAADAKPEPFYDGRLPGSI